MRSLYTSFRLEPRDEANSTIPVLATDVTVFELCGTHTIGLVLATNGSRSAAVMQAHVGRKALAAQVRRRTDDTMRIQGDGGAAPEYDRYLGCDAGQEPSSTVVVVVQNF